MTGSAQNRSGSPALPSNRKDRWVRLALLAIGIPTFLCFLIASPLIRRYYKQQKEADRKGAIAQQGVATVEALVKPGDSSLGNRLEAHVLVRFQGKLYTVKPKIETNVRDLEQGHPAQITYVVGKSGKIYVDDVGPAPTTP